MMRSARIRVWTLCRLKLAGTIDTFNLKGWMDISSPLSAAKRSFKHPLKKFREAQRVK
jgi:hypothetical protein